MPKMKDILAVPKPRATRLAPNAAGRARIVPGPQEEASEAVACCPQSELTPGQRRHRVAWADLLRRVFEHATDCTSRP